ncbi:MAG: hypothetical protein LH479_04760 [Polaromonas sp.]|nr:hypothetical protein [Polaromonas sp.]
MTLFYGAVHCVMLLYPIEQSAEILLEGPEILEVFRTEYLIASLSRQEQILAAVDSLIARRAIDELTLG